MLLYKVFWNKWERIREKGPNTILYNIFQESIRVSACNWNVRMKKIQAMIDSPISSG